MAHWASLTSTTVRPDEWRVLRAMDRAYLNACQEMSAREQASSNDPHTISERPMSPELFDAVFQ